MIVFKGTLATQCLLYSFVHKSAGKKIMIFSFKMCHLLKSCDVIKHAHRSIMKTKWLLCKQCDKRIRTKFLSYEFCTRFLNQKSPTNQKPAMNNITNCYLHK